MAYEILGHCITLRADDDLSASQFRFVVISSENSCDVADAGDDAIGVSQGNPLEGGAMSVMVGNGVSKITAGAALAAGLPVTSDSTGRAVGVTSGDHVLGYTVEAAGAANDVVAMLFQKSGNVI